ncbi:PREDICTED: uncharacterized protein LOC106740743 [Dinoponera quadriceps]|uniref:Uncharacterized protein LOC106740743 n=1 Tax=Dinoponera quadriceps TaxID=609295 RepID=A0A6P3WNY9_DINQU|nr:PREDICTED: uncharacterized protein LOC106740743 [Dinoponera quadriceps]
MNTNHTCTKSRRPTRSADTESLYDEVLHKIDDSILSVKLTKNKHRIETTDKYTVKPVKPSILVNCVDKYGNECKKDCPKVKVIHNQPPPPKKPEEEMLILQSIQHITPYNDLKHSIEVEFKSPRNYIPLPEPGPSPPIIVPKETIIVKPDKPKKK